MGGGVSSEICQISHFFYNHFKNVSVFCLKETEITCFYLNLIKKVF